MALTDRSQQLLCRLWYTTTWYNCTHTQLVLFIYFFLFYLNITHVAITQNIHITYRSFKHHNSISENYAHIQTTILYYFLALIKYSIPWGSWTKCNAEKLNAGVLLFFFWFFWNQKRKYIQLNLNKLHYYYLTDSRFSTNQRSAINIHITRIYLVMTLHYELHNLYTSPNITEREQYSKLLQI